MGEQNMRQDVRRNPREGAKGRPAGQNYSQLNRSTQQNRRGTGTAGQRPLVRQSQNFKRQPGRDWPNRLEAEQREREQKERERKKQQKLRQKRRARARRRLLFTAALFGIALFLGVRLVKNWMAGPEEKIKEAEIDIEKLAEEEEYPESLLKLLDKNPETKDFVLNYPENKDKHVEIDVSRELKEGKIPLFLQWDERWGYETYGDDFLALTGCGPTCLSMVYCGLTGDAAWNPYKTARMAENGGYYVSGSGSSWDLMTRGASELGLTAEEVVFDEEHIKAALEAGMPIICVVGPGDFTDNGHFLVLTGINEEGKILLNDPNSRIRSREAWDIEQLMGQIKNLWGYRY